MESKHSATSSINHVFFFIEDKDKAKIATSNSTSAAQVAVAQTSTRSSSPDSSSSTSSRDGGVLLSPTAPSFFPRSAQQPAPGRPMRHSHSDTTPPEATSLGDAPSALFQTCAIPGKGSGLVATTLIKRGERIICEEPLLRITRNELHLVWGPYQSLSSAQKEVYDKLYFYEREGLNLNMASRLHLLDPDDAMDSDDEDELVKEHIRVMGIFAANNTAIANNQLAVFANFSRLNHSCIPNVYHTYNANLKKETVHALRDIRPGEELLTNYMGEIANSSTRQQRWQILRKNYGFTCQCDACSDRTPVSDTRRELYGMILWGIDQYQNGRKDEAHQMIPKTPDAALKMSEDAVRLLLQQELIGLDLCRAYHLASRLALDMKDFDKAVEYAYNQYTVERNIMGTEVDDLVKQGIAASVWIEHVLDNLAKENHHLNDQLQKSLNGKKGGKSKGQIKKEKKARKMQRENDKQTPH